MPDAFFHIAIDGPSGSGKSTMAKQLARTLNIGYLDTGAMYRALGVTALARGITPSDATAVAAMLESTDLDVRFRGDVQETLIDGSDVSGQIRTPEASLAASDISALPVVRHYCVERQRTIAQNNSLILDGRDIGTYVLPNADLKFFLTADDTIRAHRRYLDLQAAGSDSTEAEVLTALRHRDQQDSTRAMAPTKAATDALIIDTGKMAADEVLQTLYNHCVERGLVRG